MYEKIMQSSGNSFFALLNAVFPENNREKESYQHNFLNTKIKNTSDDTRDNEWMQEYHIIYNSYVLEASESSVEED